MRVIGLHVLVLALVSVSLEAQRRNVIALSRTAVSGRVSDVWGHVDAVTGREFALVGSFEGLNVFDCSQPERPRLNGVIPSDSPGASGNRWQDIKVWGTTAYVVSEAYGGVQVVDLSNPDLPRKVQTFGRTLWSNAHNVALDQGTGLLYVCGTNNGTHVLDVATDPHNPVRVASLGAPYVHDLSVQDGVLYAAEINSNRLTLFDVTGLPAFAQIASVVSVGRSSCHSTWPSRDNQIVAVCHETSGGELALYDVSVPRLPRALSTYQTGTSSTIVHNPMIVDRVCHVSWNTEGYQAIDVSDPGNPVRVGFYDTSSVSGGFEGLWGVYAGLPSGLVLGSDRTGGLYVFRPRFTLRRYGRSSGTGAPRLHLFGAAWQGNGRFRVDISGVAANAAGTLALGAAAGASSSAGTPVHIDFSQPHILLPFTADAQGSAAVPLPIASGLAIGQVYVQAFVPSASGVTASSGGVVDVFTR